MAAEPVETTTPESPGAGRDPRPTRVGFVTSTKRQKTIRVVVNYLVRHRKYGKFVRKSTVLHAHDETNDANTGDKVEVVMCRPLSKTKCWRLLRVLERAPGRGQS